MERDELELIILAAWNEDREKGEPMKAFLARAAAAIRGVGYVKLAADQSLPGLQFVPQDTKKNQIAFDHYLAGYNNALSKAYQLGWRKIETKAEKP